MRTEVNLLAGRLYPLQNALNALLLIRQSDTFKPVLSHNGFYQTFLEGELLRIKLLASQQIYPQVSGQKPLCYSLFTLTVSMAQSF